MPTKYSLFKVSTAAIIHTNTILEILERRAFKILTVNTIAVLTAVLTLYKEHIVRIAKKMNFKNLLF